MKPVRVVIGVLGLDAHEAGAFAVAAMLFDAGMEVIYAGCFNTPASLVRTAIEEDADVLGLSCHSWEFVHYLPELMERLHTAGCESRLVVGGSILTGDDERRLAALGVAATFGAASTRDEIVRTIARLASAPRSNEPAIPAGKEP